MTDQAIARSILVFLAGVLLIGLAIGAGVYLAECDDRTADYCEGQP